MSSCRSIGRRDGSEGARCERGRRNRGGGEIGRRDGGEIGLRFVNGGVIATYSCILKPLRSFPTRFTNYI